MLQNFSLKLGILLQFAAPDKNMLEVKGNRDTTVLQRYSNVSIYRQVIITFAFAIGLLEKPDLERYVSAAIYHRALIGSASVVAFTMYVCYQSDSGQ